MAFSGVFPAAEVVPATFGLSSKTATVVTHSATDEYWLNKYSQEYALCDVKVEGWNLCASTSATTFSDTTSEGRFGDVQPFGVIIEDGCTDPVGSVDERKERLRTLLDVASLKAAETELWSGPVTIDNEATPADRNKYLKDGNATSVGAATGALVALAQLEDALAGCSLGEQGVIHMTRGTSILLSDALRNDADMMTTASGTPVVIGSGYTTESATQALMFGTGPVTVQLGASKFLTNGDSDFIMNPASNQLVLRAERPVAVTWDGCCHFSATVDYTA
mgnify:CR=1 FL=1